MHQTVPFTKLSATGNDFILIDNRERVFSGNEIELFHRLCERRVGIGADGILLIEARQFRTQERNREDAIQRLVELIRKAAEKPRPRKKTKPSRAAKEKRIEQKKRRSTAKKMRGRTFLDAD